MSCNQLDYTRIIPEYFILFHSASKQNSSTAQNAEGQSCAGAGTFWCGSRCQIGERNKQAVATVTESFKQLGQNIYSVW